MSKTHWKKQFNYDYLGSYSIEDGQELTLTIKETKKEMVANTGGKKEECFVCYFSDNPKPFILNRTNCKTIESLYSPYIEDWPGKKITLYVEKGIQAFGNVVDGLRVKHEHPIPLKKPELTPEHPKWPDAVQYMKKGGKLDGVRKNWDISEENAETLVFESTQ